MENFMAMKLKRKDFDQVSDDISDFSLSSPARKIRRLDAELPPIIEEEAEIPLAYEQSIPESVVKPLDIEELPSVPENEERALVLFKPMNNPQFYLSSNYSVDPSLISSFKNDALLGNHLIASRSNERGKPMSNGDNNTEDNTCRAVIPWVPSQHLNPTSAALVSQIDGSEPMDAEEMEAAAGTMEIEDTSTPNATECISHSRTNEDLQQQWQQQHCMIPQAPLNTTTPIVWYR